MATSDQPAPPWAYPLNAIQYQRFLATVAEELDYLKLDGDRIPNAAGELTVRVRDEANVVLKLNLTNTAQQAALCSESTWGNLVRQVYSNASQTSELIATSPTPETLRVRLYSADHMAGIPAMPSGHPVYRQVAGDIVETMVVDHPSVVTILMSKQLPQMGLGEDEAWQIAEANTSRILISTTRLDVGAPILLLESPEETYTGAAILWLEKALGRQLPYGALVSVPTRVLILAHPIRDNSCRSALINMAVRAEGAARKGPYGLSSKLYWYHDSRLEAIDIHVDFNNNTLVLRGPVALERAMSQAAAGR